MITTLPKLPTPDAGDWAWRKFFDAYGHPNANTFVRWIRDHRTETTGDFLDTMAARRVQHHIAADPTLGYTRARARAAADFGAVGQNVPNFIKAANRGRALLEATGEWDTGLRTIQPQPTPDPASLTELPTRADGTAGLQRFVNAYGEDAAYRFMRWIRDHRTAGGKSITEFLCKNVARAVRNAMRNDITLDYETARQKVARDWGYTGDGISNLYRDISRGRQMLIDAGEWS